MSSHRPAARRVFFFRLRREQVSQTLEGLGVSARNALRASQSRSGCTLHAKAVVQIFPMQFDIKDRVLTALAILLALAGMRSEDPWVIYPGLLGSWGCLIAVCTLHRGSIGWRVAAGSIVTIGFVVFAARMYCQQLQEEQADVFNHLGFSMATPSGEDFRSTSVTVRNGGHTSIQYRLSCHLTMVVSNNGLSVIGDSLISDHERSGVLDSGSDAQADDCLSAISTNTLDCADVKVRLFYSLQDQPSVPKEKDHGFITHKSGQALEWLDRSVEQKESDCAALVRIKFRDPDDDLRKLASEMREQNTETLKVFDINPSKKLAARLSNEIFQFGQNESTNIPKEPDYELSSMEERLEYQRKFTEWGEKSAKKFHANFDVSLGEVFDGVRRLGMSEDPSRTDCMIISKQVPPTLSQTERCGIDLGSLALRIIDH